MRLGAPPTMEFRPLDVPPPPFASMEGPDKHADIRAFPIGDSGLGRPTFLNIGSDGQVHVYEGQWRKAPNVTVQNFSAA